MDGSLTYGQICRVIKGVNSEIRQDRKESVGRQDKKESPGRRGAVSSKQVRTMDQRSAAVMRYALLSRVHVHVHVIVSIRARTRVCLLVFVRTCVLRFLRMRMLRLLPLTHAQMLTCPPTP